VTPERHSRWGLNALGVLLSSLLLAAIAFSGALWVKLEAARGELRASDAAEEAARIKQERRMAEQAQTAAATPVAPPVDAQAVAPAPPQPAASEERLFLLLTVGTQHYAEKQKRLLQLKCKVPLAVYQQRHGRCGWSTCFAVAAKESDAELARTCGETKGQALRDRRDFIAVP
jgi:hypothetical protein